MDWSQINHFTQNEWEPNADKVDPKLIFLMDEIRQEYSKPLVIHCAFAQSGHSSKSQHYLGKAVDFHFADTDYTAQFDLLRSYDDVGGVGWYPDWRHPGYHLDIRPKRLYWIQKNGQYIYSLEAVLEDLNA